MNTRSSALLKFVGRLKLGELVAMIAGERRLSEDCENATCFLAMLKSFDRQLLTDLSFDLVGFVSNFLFEFVFFFSDDTVGCFGTASFT